MSIISQAPPTQASSSGAGGPPTASAGYSGITPPPWAAWGGFGVGYLSDDIPQLNWPANIKVYSRMRTDAQVDALFRSITLPIYRRKAVLRPRGARDEIVAKIAADWGLPIQGTDEPPAGRRAFRYGFARRHSMLALLFGHMFMEITGEYREGVDPYWHMVDLEPRMPQSIQQIRVTPRGDLEGIVQYGSMNAAYGGKVIPKTSLAAYVWDREGANWSGRSMLRSCFRHWILKDRLLRVDAMKNERFGIGVPVENAPAGASEEIVAQYAEQAQAIRASDASGVGLPAGASLQIEGIRGTLPDTLASIAYQDMAMARSFLAMFLELGTTRTGSRALGGVFVDFFGMAVDAVADWHLDETNTVIERDVDWNWGQQENAPQVVFERDEEEATPLAASDLIAMVESGVLIVDDEVANWIRNQWNMPPREPGAPAMGEPAANPVKDTTEGTTTPAGYVAAEGRRTRPVRKVEARKQTLNDSAVGHREPTTVEAAARTDFAQIQQAWRSATDQLKGAWKDVQARQIDALAASIEEAVNDNNLIGLADLAAPVEGADILTQHLTAMMESAVTAARQEAAAQGVTIPTVNTAEVARKVATRADAVAALMSRSIAEVAARQSLNRYGTALSGADVAQGVRDHIAGLSDSYLDDQLGGALTAAQNAGRLAVMSEAPSTIYASELLDEATCDPCSGIDGTEYATEGDAINDYPTGGYVDCLGLERCRGTLVAIYAEGDQADQSDQG